MTKSYKEVESECMIISKSTIAKEKIHFSTFSNEKPKGLYLTSPENKSRSNHGHHLYNFYKSKPQMLRTMFQGNQPSGSGEEDFYDFLSYMGMAAFMAM